MIVTVDCKDEAKADMLTEAAYFYTEILLGPRFVNSNKLIIDIDVIRGLDVAGECVNEDATKRSRWFTINLKDASPNKMAQTLAHEMCHVKQHIRNEIGTLEMVFRDEKETHRISLPMWKDKVWTPKKNEHLYYDQPCELEAFGREVGLAARFSHHWNELQSG